MKHDDCLTLRENNLRRQLLANKRSETTPLPLQTNHKPTTINPQSIHNQSTQIIHRTVLGTA